MKENSKKSKRYHNLLDDFGNFKKTYYQIVQDFHFDMEKDKESQMLLNQFLELKEENWDLNNVIHNFQKRLQKKAIICIYGAGPSLEPCIKNLEKKSHKKILNKAVNLAADGASVLLRKYGILIDGIFTDLDGISPKEFRYGKYLIIHAHGDNIEKLNFFKQEIIKKRNVIGTCQVEPKNLIFNPGGFTDGDRILFFIKNLLRPSQKLCFFGMDFGSTVGRYSKPTLQREQKANQNKKEKLHYARLLIKKISDKIPNTCYFVEPKTRPEDFSTISLKEFIKLMKI
ncbi:MAG: 6-hydroxymethylpterin diphosphokinase MptE-like protein [Promethearchaeia archaeon]